MRNKKILIVIILIVIAVLVCALIYVKINKNLLNKPQVVKHESKIQYYTCGMHPNIKISPEEYDKGNKNCPICNMKLTPIYKKAKTEETVYYGCGMEGDQHMFLMSDALKLKNCPVCGMELKKISKKEADKLKGIVSRVEIKGEQVSLAGVKTEPVRRLHLYKEIRTVGRVAYDPQLAIAQEEFLSSLKALDKIQQGDIPEIEERALSLVNSAKRKLRLLGLSQKQIAELEKKKQIQKNLILPEETMWVYGDIYEYELSWLKTGEKVKISTSSLSGEVFYGIIASVNPILDPKTRSVRFRAKVSNPGLKLKPEMYVDVVIQSMYVDSEGNMNVLALPKQALLDTGMRKIVWIDRGDGKYEGRVIKVGPEAVGMVDGREEKFYPILKGLNENEKVVTNANFLIDSQSQISGVAASIYGGALEEKNKKMPPMQHQH